MKAIALSEVFELSEGDVPGANCVITAVKHNGELLSVYEYHVDVEVDKETGKPDAFILSGRGFTEDEENTPTYKTFKLPRAILDETRCVMEESYNGKPVFRKFQINRTFSNYFFIGRGHLEFQVWYNNGPRLNNLFRVPIHVMLRWYQYHKLSLNGILLDYRWNHASRTMECRNEEKAFKVELRDFKFIFFCRREVESISFEADKAPDWFDMSRSRYTIVTDESNNMLFFSIEKE